MFPAGAQLSFEVTFDSPSLVVGLSAYDFSGVTPVLVFGPSAMTSVVGNTYVGKFTPTANIDYFIFKAVYTDGTFTVLDPNYSESNTSESLGNEYISKVAFDSPSLNIGMSIYDMTGIIPVLVSGPTPMSNVVGNTYVAKFLPDATKSYLIFNAVYTDNTFTTLDPEYSQNSNTLQVSSTVQPPIEPPGVCQFVELPDMNGAMLSWFQDMEFELVVKSVKNFQAVEVGTLYDFQGVWQPFSATQLKLKPEGQRVWSWFMLHSDPSLQLANDDVVNYGGNNYRVMEQSDYSCYGYMEYHVIRDWTGSGPIV